jgi:dihydrofolate reductase
MNAIPKLVFTNEALGAAKLTKAFDTASAERKDKRTLSDKEVKANLETWKSPSVATDLVREIEQRKRDDGRDLVAHGGASFAQSLAKIGLVDEYRFLVHPVVLGRGLTLFSVVSDRMPLTLLSSTIRKVPGLGR